MSSILCFVCHNTVTCDTQEEMREKYREVVGMNVGKVLIELCPDSHLCYICCHLLNKLINFRSVCLKRSLEYPVLFSEKSVINLQRNDIQHHILCPDESCQEANRVNYQINYEGYSDCSHYNEQNYIKLEDDYEYTNADNISVNIDTEKCNEFDAETKTDNEHIDSMENVYDIAQYSNTDNNNCINDEEVNNCQTEDDIDRYDEPQNIPNEITEDTYKDHKHKSNKKSKKKGFVKIVLSVEKQKAELEANRKGKKYMESEFKCYNCALGFLFKDTYQAHMMRHEESNGEYRCDMCTLRFATPAVLRSHTSLHTERYRCTRCDRLLRPRARAKHAIECQNKTATDYVSCHLCANLFKDASGLQQHLRRVHNAKSGRVYPCSVCGEVCKTQASVRTHMLKHLKKKFTCTECPAVYSSPYTLNQHKKTHQMGQERHFCTTCGVSYGTRKSLMAHRRNSLNHQQTVFECSKCPRVLPHRRALEAHEGKYHSDDRHPTAPRVQYARTRRTNTERVVCYMCGKSFKGNSKLNRHLREVCEKVKTNEDPEPMY